MLDVVGIVLENLTDEKEGNENLVDNLISKGFTLAEIEGAFRWIAKAIFSDTERTSSSQSLRILTPHEKAKITPQAWGMLIRLKKKRIIDDYLLEEILEKAMDTSEETVNIEKMKALVQVTLFNSSQLKWEGPANSLLH